MGWLSTDHQQQKAKMPAAGATQALRLFCNPLCAIARACLGARAENQKMQGINNENEKSQY